MCVHAFPPPATRRHSILMTDAVYQYTVVRIRLVQVAHIYSPVNCVLFVPRAFTHSHTYTVILQVYIHRTSTLVLLQYIYNSTIALTHSHTIYSTDGIRYIYGIQYTVYTVYYIVTHTAQFKYKYSFINISVPQCYIHTIYRYIPPTVVYMWYIILWQCQCQCQCYSVT